MQRSKKGRPRNVIAQGNAKLAFTGKSITSHAGMALIARQWHLATGAATRFRRSG